MINVRGVDFSLHPLFVIIMLTSVLTGHFIELFTLFMIVFIHEMGHLSAAVGLGIKVRSVQLLPFGGVVHIEEEGKMTAVKEILIALAGPLQNVIMILGVLLLRQLGWGDEAFLTYLIQGNMIIACFNLLPILPLDGGRIIQALASCYLPYHATLLWCARISVICSAGTILYALLPFFMKQGPIQLNLLMIGTFLLYSNWTDYRHVPYRFMRFLVSRERYKEGASRVSSITQPIMADPMKPLESILRLFRRGKYHLVYVVNAQGEVFAVLPEQSLIEAYFASKEKDE